MLLALGDICFDNLSCGVIRVSKLSSEDASKRLSQASKKGDITGLYDFGSVPDERRKRTFLEILSALDETTGVKVTYEDFLLRGSEGDDVVPIPANLFSLSDSRPILLVKYFLEPDFEAREKFRKEDDQRKDVKGNTPEGGEESRKDALSRFDRLFRMRVCRDRLEFFSVDLEHTRK